MSRLDGVVFIYCYLLRVILVLALEISDHVKKVQKGNDQENVQSERNSHSKTRDGEKQN